MAIYKDYIDKAMSNKKTAGFVSISSVLAIAGTAIGSHYLEIESWVIENLIPLHTGLR